MRLAGSVELTIGVLFLFQVLDDCFDNDVAISQLVKRRGAKQTIASLFLLLGSDCSFGSELFQRLFDSREAFLQQLFRNFAYRRFKARARGRLSNPCAHQPATEHANFLDFHLSLLLYAVKSVPPASAGGSKTHHSEVDQ